nr:MAG TPA: hypothetical protein [Caudoviricetes sp.]
MKCFGFVFISKQHYSQLLKVLIKKVDSFSRVLGHFHILDI